MTTIHQENDSRSLLDELLDDQQHLSAVEKFSQFHESADGPLLKSHYRDLIPATPPEPGQQYAFEVDLDACSGCKACVTACHNLNGLEEDETWRSVGLLLGGSQTLPVLQHVTTACHHCIEPGCLQGCPVNAYDKDPITGIVKHLDDQCIGCQYCMLKCPYDVPKYSKSKGIVRKCDMCQDRLKDNEAPACVQACPHEAIRISLVNVESVREDVEADYFLAGAPDPTYTLPTTQYKTSKPFPRNTKPADYFSARTQHAHWPLVWMLVLTQMSVGAFASEYLLAFLVPTSEPPSAGGHAVQILSAWVLGMVGLGASIFHLGRPFYAFRALLGLRTSWMSREILCFNLFAGAATMYALTAAAALVGWEVPAVITNAFAVGAVIGGLAAVFCSAMIYIDTQRPFWGVSQTTTKFLLTSAVLGLPVTFLISLIAASISGPSFVAEFNANTGRWLLQAVIVAASCKLLFEATLFGHLTDRKHTPMRRSASFYLHELRRAAIIRFACGAIGGVVAPALLLITSGNSSVLSLSIQTALAIGSVAFLFAGEIAERYLFFTAVAAPKMPGGPVR